MADVFISYSRRDATFVRELHGYLIGAGRDVWVDWEDIAPASQWERDIGESIDAAESFVFVISGNSLASEYCGIELERAQKGGKRVVPLACEDVDPASAPAGLRELNWIWCRNGDDRGAAFDRVTGALDTDLEWARAHTRLLVRAVEWDARKDSSLLLRGRDLEDAAQQLAVNAAKQPAPTELQQQYLLASRRATAKRQRVTLGGVTLALVVSLALGVVAFLQRNAANDRARIAESQALAAKAEEALSTAPAAALADGVKAFETSRTPEARVALRRAILANPIDYVIPPGSNKVDVARPILAFSRDGKLLLALTPDGALHVWRSTGGSPVAVGQTTSRATSAALASGRLLSAGGGSVRLVPLGAGGSTVHRVPRGDHVAGIGLAGSVPLALVAGGGTAEVLDVAAGRAVRLRGRRVSAAQAVFSGDGSRVVTFARNAQAWDTRTGRLVATLPDATSAAVSADGRFVATTGFRGATLWSVARRTRLANLGAAVRVLFSPDGSLAVAVGENGDAGVWRSSSGRLVATLPGFGSLHRGRGTFTTGFKPGAAFNRDGRLLALASSDGLVRVWDLATRKQVAAVAAGWANTLAFSPRGNVLAAMTWNGDVVVAHAPASVALVTGFPPNSCIADFAPVVSRDGSRIAAPTRGGAGVWGTDGERLQLLRTPARPASEATVSTAAFSGDGTVIAAGAVAGLCFQRASQRVWTALWRPGSRAPFRRLPATYSAVALDPHGSLVAGGGKAWRTATGAQVHALDGIVALSPDGRLALVGRGRATAIVRVRSGALVATLRGLGQFRLDDGVSAAFSPDGARVVTSGVDTLRLWKTATGEPVARLGSSAELLDYGFGQGGRLVLAVFDNRAATFSAADGSPVFSLTGQFAAISPDGALAAAVRADGSVEVVDPASRLRVAVQTDTAEPLESVSFGPDPSLLVAVDQKGDVHVLRCAICAPEEELLTRARSRLALVSRFHSPPPPVSGVA